MADRRGRIGRGCPSRRTPPNVPERAKGPFSARRPAQRSFLQRTLPATDADGQAGAEARASPSCARSAPSASSATPKRSAHRLPNRPVPIGPSSSAAGVSTRCTSVGWLDCGADHPSKWVGAGAGRCGHPIAYGDHGRVAPVRLTSFAARLARLLRELRQQLHAWSAARRPWHRRSRWRQ
jgi:hypothetical protein